MIRCRPRTKLLTLAMSLRLFCALAIAMIGFAHQPAFAAQALGSEISVLPDGEVAAMCLSSADVGGKKAPGGSACEACRLSAACLLPTPTESAAVVFRAVLATLQPGLRESPPLDVLSYRGAPRASPAV
jgi:hypothetical protein